MFCQYMLFPYVVVGTVCKVKGIFSNFRYSFVTFSNSNRQEWDNHFLNNDMYTMFRSSIRKCPVSYPWNGAAINFSALPTSGSNATQFHWTLIGYFLIPPLNKGVILTLITFIPHAVGSNTFITWTHCCSYFGMECLCLIISINCLLHKRGIRSGWFFCKIVWYPLSFSKYSFLPTRWNSLIPSFLHSRSKSTWYLLHFTTHFVRYFLLLFYYYQSQITFSSSLWDTLYFFQTMSLWKLLFTNVSGGIQPISMLPSRIWSQDLSLMDLFQILEHPVPHLDIHHCP